jgi:dihydrofolate reductase
MRASCSVFIAVSVDGFIARPDGGIDWLSIVERPGEDYGYQRFFDSVDTLLIGRKTYDVALGFEPWPYAGKRCVVLTQRALTPRHDETFESGAPDAIVDRLTALGSRRVYVDGGTVIQQFLAAGLVTDLTLNVVPVVLGEGVPLFGKTGRDLGLELVDTRRFDSGLVQVGYRLAR